ncbi:MAG: polysaccharide biosynthesis C-terminal domain-containing protein [Actinobacteria bacterium]|nr:polysaccharide biosynthesis C-terminal domain-containing protein [Actinomycetota bacterium]
MTRERGIAAQIVVATTGNIAIPVAAFASAPILARVLGVEERGVVAAGTAPLLLAISALTLGIPEAVTYFVSKNGPNRAAVLKAVQITCLAALLGMILLGVIATAVTPEVQLFILMLVASSALAPALIVGVLRAYAGGLGLWTVISWERFIGAVARLFAILLLACSGQLTVFTGTIAISTTTFVGGFAYIGLAKRRLLVVREAGSTNRADLLAFGLRLWPGALAGILLSRLDQTLMIGLTKTSELGIYAVSVSVSEVTLVFNSAVRDVMFARESRQGSPDRLMRAARISTVGTLMASVCAGVLSIWMLPILFGEEFRNSVFVAEILLLGIVAGNPGSIAGAGLSARGRPSLRSLSLVIALCVNVAAVVVLVPPLGAVGAAVATAVGNFIAGTLNIFWLRRYYGFSALGFVVPNLSDLLAVRAVVRRVVGPAGGLRRSAFCGMLSSMNSERRQGK